MVRESTTWSQKVCTGPIFNMNVKPTAVRWMHGWACEIQTFRLPWCDEAPAWKCCVVGKGKSYDMSSEVCGIQYATYGMQYKYHTYLSVLLRPFRQDQNNYSRHRWTSSARRQNSKKNHRHQARPKNFYNIFSKIFLNFYGIYNGFI